MSNFIDLLENSKKPIIGMVHLAGLPGSVHFTESFQSTVQRSVNEMKILMDAGFDGSFSRTLEIFLHWKKGMKLQWLS